MSVNYKVIQRGEPGVIGGGTKKYYAAVEPGKTLRLDELSQDIADNTTVSETDAYAVLKALEKQLPKQLSRGFKIKLGDFGYFRLSISSTGHDNEEDVSEHSIKKSRIIFTPGKYIKDVLKTVRYLKNGG